MYPIFGPGNLVVGYITFVMFDPRLASFDILSCMLLPVLPVVPVLPVLPVVPVVPVLPDVPLPVLPDVPLPVLPVLPDVVPVLPLLVELEGDHFVPSDNSISHCTITKEMVEENLKPMESNPFKLEMKKF